MDKVELTRAAQQQLPSHDRQEVDYENFRKLVLGISVIVRGDDALGRAVAP
jgi:hypothetical protein